MVKNVMRGGSGVHLSGLGLPGSLAAVLLDAAGVDFTWDDADAAHTAWKACTGACYPAAGALAEFNYNAWRSWAASSRFGGHVAEAAYWVDGVHRALPHGLAADVADTAGGMRRVGVSVHVNAQALVADARRAFAARRRPSPPPGRLVITSRGFTESTPRYLWGWTRLVRLRYPARLDAGLGAASFYLRKSRFEFAYCYPRPGSGWWYAGSSLVSQRVPRPLDARPRYERWRRNFAELSGGVVDVVAEGRLLEGWRPARAGGLSGAEGYKSGASYDPAAWLEDGPGGPAFPVLTSNGFRGFPAVWRALAARLGVPDGLGEDRRGNTAGGPGGGGGATKKAPGFNPGALRSRAGVTTSGRRPVPCARPR